MLVYCWWVSWEGAVWHSLKRIESGRGGFRTEMPSRYGGLMMAILWLEEAKIGSSKMIGERTLGLDGRSHVQNIHSYHHQMMMACPIP